VPLKPLFATEAATQSTGAIAEFGVAGRNFIPMIRLARLAFCGGPQYRFIK
jgi:hypothetical protein